MNSPAATTRTLLLKIMASVVTLLTALSGIFNEIIISIALCVWAVEIADRYHGWVIIKHQPELLINENVKLIPILLLEKSAIDEIKIRYQANYLHVWFFSPQALAADRVTKAPSFLIARRLARCMQYFQLPLDKHLRAAPIPERRQNWPHRTPAPYWRHPKSSACWAIKRAKAYITASRMSRLYSAATSHYPVNATFDTTFCRSLHSAKRSNKLIIRNR